MKLKLLVAVLSMVPCVCGAVTRDDSVRVGVKRASASGVRAPSMGAIKATVGAGVTNVSAASVDTDKVADKVAENTTTTVQGDCRDAYRACMDEFCLLDESEGYRCACSNNILASKPLILEIQNIQAEADDLYTDGVEREKLGAKSVLIFGDSDLFKSKFKVLGVSYTDWLSGGVDGADVELDDDSGIGDALYEMASGYCAAELEACGTKSEMEQALYARQIVSDCKAFNSYLADQKVNAQANKRMAEAAVRQARLSVFDTTNKYNTGECLLAYRACVADKGGCGTNFENCLSADLLERRARACDNVLDQCLAVRDDVKKLWEEEATDILAEATKYADKYYRQTCLAQIQVCLEDGCSTTTDSTCLSDINVAAGICPIIDDCNDKIPGLKNVVKDKLGYLRLQFCQNDVDACLRDKCGANFTAPECLGKSTKTIMAMCPQNLFPTCKNETADTFTAITSSALLQMDYKMVQGCINHFSDMLGRTCGTDMNCLPSDETVAALTADQLLGDDNKLVSENITKLRNTVRKNAKTAVDNFFIKFENETTVLACKSAMTGVDNNKTVGKSIGDSVFSTAKIIAEISAENRALRALETKIADISRQADIDSARKLCLETYKVETPDTDAENKNYSYIKSVAFEPSLRNCHVCRVQQVCETGGETQASAGLKSAAGGLAAGASMGTMISPGWGTAIGGAIGAIGAGLAGGLGAGEEEFCQQIESCEDVNM